MAFWASPCSSASGKNEMLSTLEIMLTQNSFCITDVQALVDSDSDFAIIEVIFNATGSRAATVVLGSILLVLLFFSTVTTVASASRQIWAFSRDQVRLSIAASHARTDNSPGLPFLDVDTPGRAKVRDSSQRAPRMSWSFLCDLCHQLRLRHRVQRSRWCLQCSSWLLLHHLGWMPSTQATARRAFASMSLVSGQMGWPYQRHHTGVPRCDICLLFLPHRSVRGRSGLGIELQLCHLHFLGRLFARARLLRPGRWSQVHRSGILGQTGLSSSDGGRLPGGIVFTTRSWTNWRDLRVERCGWPA